MIAAKEASPRACFDRELVAAMPHLRKVALGITRNAESAEDLFQTGLEKALRYADSYVDGTNIVAWVALIMRNQFYTERRRAWRVVEMADGQAERVPMPASAHHICELKDALSAVAYLPREQLDAFAAVVLEEESYEDAAQRLGCEVGTLKSRVSRARDAIDIYFGACLSGFHP